MNKFFTRFLLSFSRQRQQGFTLIELLVVIMIIGILSAIALPSFMNQVNKAKESEAQQTISQSIKLQLDYQLENQKFTTNLSDIIPPQVSETANYKYSLYNDFPQPIRINSFPTAIIIGESKQVNILKSFVGIIYFEKDGQTPRSMLCKAILSDFLLQIAPKLLANQFQDPAVTNACR